MLHEILLSLSGHPSPLLRDGHTDASGQALLSAPEREILGTAGRLSELHCNLAKFTSRISASHPSVICRAVSTTISSVYLNAFQRKILEVEDGILRKDAGLVGAYNIVPLTAVIGEFSDWNRRMEWLWDLTQFMATKADDGPMCRGARLIDKLRAELQTGYADVEETALTLVKSAETAWLKQVSAWVLYGRLPSFAADDFFVQRDEAHEEGYRINTDLLPSFVTSASAASMLFVGTSLNRVRARSVPEPTIGGLDHLSSQLQELSTLTLPLSSSTLSRAITSIRLTLSRTTLQKLLPLEKVIEMLQLLRQFMLLGRGEFAMALTQQADEKMRSRWQRADNLAYERRDGLGTTVIKEGEVATVLARTWAVLGSLQGQHSEEDEGLELARDLVQLTLAKSSKGTSADTPNDLATTPFRNLLLSVPVDMKVQIPRPLDLFLSKRDVQTYTSINAYLLSIRRAHLRLTDLWKAQRLRRHHPAPPRPPFSSSRMGMAKTRTLRERWSARSSTMRGAWTTSSAAIFFLAETEAYLQVEIVEGLWSDFRLWLTGKDEGSHAKSSSSSSRQRATKNLRFPDDPEPWIEGAQAQSQPSSRPSMSSSRARVSPAGSSNRDPQTLSIAHRLFLRVLVRRILLTQPAFTEPLYNLLIHTDHLVALIHRLDHIWTMMDLETDEGVVDAFSNLEAEEADVKAHLRAVQASVKAGVEEVVGVLQDLSVNSSFLAEMEDDGLDGSTDEQILAEEQEGRYRPKRTGGIDRFLMKLDFGGWFDSGRDNGSGFDEKYQ